MSTPNDPLGAVARALRKEAKARTGKPPTFRIFRGWKFGLSYGPLPMPDRAVIEALKGPIAARVGQPELAHASYEQIAAAVACADKTPAYDHQWIFSASLHPRGRASIEDDWTLLGQMWSAIGAPIDSCRTPIETTDPNDVHYWIWTEEPAS
jgi:hypothetical protein